MPLRAPASARSRALLRRLARFTRRRMRRPPVTGDLGPRRDPDVRAPRDVVEEPRERAGPPRAADDARVQADVHQPPALLEELVEGVQQVAVEALAVGEAAAGQ